MMIGYGWEYENPERKEPTEQFKQELAEKYPQDTELQIAIANLTYLTYDELKVLYSMGDENTGKHFNFKDTYIKLFDTTYPNRCKCGKYFHIELREAIKEEMGKREQAKMDKEILYKKRNEIIDKILYFSRELEELQNQINET